MRRRALDTTTPCVGASRRRRYIGIHTDEAHRSPSANGISTSKSPPATQVDENMAVLRATACEGCDGVTHRRVDACRGAGIALPSMPPEHGYRHLPMALAEAQTHLQLRQARIWLCCMRRRAAMSRTQATSHASRCDARRRTHAPYACAHTRARWVRAWGGVARGERGGGPPLDRQPHAPLRPAVTIHITA